MIIAISGIDASGKHTQATAVAEALRAAGVEDVATHDFPHYQGTSGGVIGRVLRGETLIVPAEELAHAATQSFNRTTHSDWVGGQLLVAELAKSWSSDKAHLIQSMMLADRYEHIHLLEKYEDDLEGVLVLDRYVLDGIVYGQVDGIALEWLETTQKSLPAPAWSFLLDITVEESIRRRPTRRDYYEKNAEKLMRVRDQYLVEFDRRPRHVVLDGTLPPVELTRHIVHYVMHGFAAL